VSGKGLNRWAAAAALILALPQIAQAYVDPGTGAMLWQVGAASVIGALFYVKRIAAWLRNRLGLRSERAFGYAFATFFALVTSPITMALFHQHALPRFNDVFLVGVVLTAYFFTWDASVYLLLVSLLVSAWILPPDGSLAVQQFADWYRLISFGALGVFLVCLISRMKARSSAIRADEEGPFEMSRLAASGD
jgi:K+-sensing histidine kinase KdpD